jgi:hypothetical protein
VIFCPACAIKHGKPNGATSTGESFETLNVTVANLNQGPGPRRCLIVFRGKCLGCESQVVTEQDAFLDGEGTWRITRVAQ